MTALLASVTDRREIRVALASGADIIDLKDPAAGALGALPLASIRDAVSAVDGRRPVSATVGDLPPVPETVAAAVEATADTGVDFIKVGFFSDEHIALCLEALFPCAARGMALIAVLFADRNPARTALAQFAEAGFAGVMLDTADKKGGGLRQWMSRDRLVDFVQGGREHGLLVGLAGSLGVRDIAPLLALAPDYLGFRTALCDQGQRTGRVDPQACALVRASIPAS